MVALLLAACGGQGAPSTQALQQAAAGLQSVAAEGGILASDAARGRSTSTFVRLHAAELSTAAAASGSVFERGRTPAARALASLAARVEGELRSLSHSGSDRTLERRLAAQLMHGANRAETLGKQL